MENAEMTLKVKDVRRLDSDSSVERSPVPGQRIRITESCNEYVRLSSGETDCVGEDKPEMVELAQHERRSRGGLEAGTSPLGTQYADVRSHRVTESCDVRLSCGNVSTRVDENRLETVGLRRGSRDA